MTDSEHSSYVEWIAREARRPVVMDAGARDRLMAAVRAEPVHILVRGRVGNASNSSPNRAFLTTPVRAHSRCRPRRHRCLCRG
jgi:hypothetical protein